MAWTKSKEVILAEIATMDNVTLYTELLAHASGDDHDGHFTEQGHFTYENMYQEFTSRLKQHGFL